MYWTLNHFGYKAQNYFILLASYVFYGWWDPRFLGLIAISTLVDFYAGRRIQDELNLPQKKVWLSISILVNLGLLAYFKYFNFFIGSFVSLFNELGVDLHYESVSIILPVGISFYTFQTLSYTIDIYRNQMKATTSLVEFATFVSFFPQLVAGPIERAKDLLPQFQKKRTFNYMLAKSGLRLILWGLFKKIVIADNCGEIVDEVFNNPISFSGRTLWVAAFFFSFQIYGDFSGYSDMAIGIGRLFGIKLSVNFRYPFFARNQAELWKRWHISLTKWFKSYVFDTLYKKGFSKTQSLSLIFLIFILSGLWHGAGPTYLLWGAFFGIAFLTDRFFLNIIRKKKKIRSIGEKPVFHLIGVFRTYLIFVFAGIIFRCDSITTMNKYFNGLFSRSILKYIDNSFNEKAYTIGLLIGFLILIEFIGRKNDFALEKFALIKPRVIRWSLYSGILGLIALFMHTESKSFIYFQF